MTPTTLDKAVILARGLGTRMRRADDEAGLDDRQADVAETGVKALMPIDRPFLDYLLSAVADAGYRRVCLVTGPEQRALHEYYGERVGAQRLSIELAVQEQPRGTADAVAAAERFAAGDPFLALNCDNYYPVDAMTALRREDGPATALFSREAMAAGSNVSPERLRQFAIGRIDAAGRLERIIEKPDRAVWSSLPSPIWISMNCWRFDSSIFEACRSIEPSPRGEYELTDAVQYAIDSLGLSFRVVRIHAAVLDLSCRADVPQVAAKLAGVEVRL